MAAVFAVLTRMRKPNPDRYARGVGAIISALSAVEKADLYAQGKSPERLDADSQKLLRAAIKDVWTESDAYPIYEGRVGASPREMRVALLDAAQSTKFRCLNPQAVLEEIEALCERRNEFEWLQQDAVGGGYHEVKVFIDVLFGRLLHASEYELYVASGLVKEEQYVELFDRYVQHVNVWVKKERLYNRVMQRHEEPDDKMMAEVERLLDVKIEPDEWRRQLISSIAAWAIDHPGQKVDPTGVFPQHLRRMREAIFGDRLQDIANIARDVVLLVREEGVGLDAERRREAEGTIERLTLRFGYCRNCAGDLASLLVKKRFHNLIV
jgi:predicted Ser/Thr protein kinase